MFISDMIEVYVIYNQSKGTIFGKQMTTSYRCLYT